MPRRSLHRPRTRIYVTTYRDDAATAAREEDDGGSGVGTDISVVRGRVDVPVVHVCVSAPSALLTSAAGASVGVDAEGGIPSDPNTYNGGDVPALPNDPAEPAPSTRATCFSPHQFRH
jgi:hypothetical protein